MVRLRSRPVGPRWLVVAAVAVALLVSAIVPTGDAVARSGPFGIPVDLWLHAIGYAVLQVAVLAALSTDHEPPLPVGATPVAVAGYGLVLEGIQLGVPYRTGSLTDALANTVGAILALACWYLVVHHH